MSRFFGTKFRFFIKTIAYSNVETTYGLTYKHEYLHKPVKLAVVNDI